MYWLGLWGFLSQPGNSVQWISWEKKEEKKNNKEVRNGPDLFYSSNLIDRGCIILHERRLSLSSHRTPHTKLSYKWAMATEAFLKVRVFCSAADTRVTELSSCSVYTIWSTRACEGWCNLRAHTQARCFCQNPFPSPSNTAPLTECFTTDVVWPKGAQRTDVLKKKTTNSCEIAACCVLVESERYIRQNTLDRKKILERWNRIVPNTTSVSGNDMAVVVFFFQMWDK